MKCYWISTKGIFLCCDSVCFGTIDRWLYVSLQMIFTHLSFTQLSINTLNFFCLFFDGHGHSHEKMKKMSNAIDDAIVQIDQNADSQACIILSLIRSIDKINTRKSKNVKQNIAYLKHLRIKSRTFGLIFSRFDLFLLVITKINL